MTDMHAGRGSASRNDTIRRRQSRPAMWPTWMFWIWVLVILAVTASFFWTGVTLPSWPW